MIHRVWEEPWSTTRSRKERNLKGNPINQRELWMEEFYSRSERCGDSSRTLLQVWKSKKGAKFVIALIENTFLDDVLSCDEDVTRAIRKRAAANVLIMIMIVWLSTLEIAQGRYGFYVKEGFTLVHLENSANSSEVRLRTGLEDDVWVITDFTIRIINSCVSHSTNERSRVIFNIAPKGRLENRIIQL